MARNAIFKVSAKMECQLMVNLRMKMGTRMRALLRIISQREPVYGETRLEYTLGSSTMDNLLMAKLHTLMEVGMKATL